MTSPQSRLASPRAIEADPWKLLPPIGEFSLYFIILSLISTLIAGNWAWIPQTWGATCVTTLNSRSFSYLRHNFALPQVDPSWPDAKYRAVVVFFHRDVWLFSTFLFDGLFSASHHLCGSNLFKVPVRDSNLSIRVTKLDIVNHQIRCAVCILRHPRHLRDIQSLRNTIRSRTFPQYDRHFPRIIPM